MKYNEAFVIGVDFGTDSVRSVVVNAANGMEVASSVFLYPRWKDGLYCNPAQNQFRQHPLDYIEGLEDTIRRCLLEAGPAVAAQIKAISIDTTGSTPIAVDESGTPLALLSGFEENPNAMFVLWKDHTSVQEAEEINRHAQNFEINYLRYVGGIYSSEWFWAKLLHVLRGDERVRSQIYSWVEHCDWIPYLLTGETDIKRMRRGVCSAGHKSLWSEQWGGLPPDEFFAGLDPMLKGFRQKLFDQVLTSDQAAGKISAEWAKRLGLPADVLIGVGAFDCHMGAVGGQIEPYYLSKVMGTSTCDMLVAPPEEVNDILVKGICGQVPGSIIPGMIGMEAGQSAFGDAYAWFRNLISWPLQHLLAQSPHLDVATANLVIGEASEKILAELSKHASALPLQEKDELAVDWLNGRRTPDANQMLKAAITGMDLATDAPAVFKAIVEATCFGAKAIVDRFRKEGIPIKGLIALGGVARKSPYIMQVMADVMGMPIKVHRSEQTCALGAAMFAATVAGIYPKVEEAMKEMGQGFDAFYQPDATRSVIYSRRYNQYQQLASFIEDQASGENKPVNSQKEHKALMNP